MNLTERLLKITTLIDKCNRLADIGTDHAYIPIYCVENELCNYALACDVKKGPLKIADKNIEKYNMKNKIETRLSNGLENYKKCEADCVVIAGMGGLLINEILEKSLDKIADNTTLILQPMIAVYEVRKFLLDNGFCITYEALAKEEKKIYNIIKCRLGNETYSEYELYVGKKLIENKDYLLKQHMENKIYTTKKVLEGLKKSSGKYEEINHYKKVLSYYEKAKDEV